MSPILTKDGGGGGGGAEVAQYAVVQALRWRKKYKLKPGYTWKPTSWHRHRRGSGDNIVHEASGHFVSPYLVNSNVNAVPLHRR